MVSGHERHPRWTKTQMGTRAIGRELENYLCAEFLNSCPPREFSPPNARRPRCTHCVMETTATGGSRCGNSWQPNNSTKQFNQTVGNQIIGTPTNQYSRRRLSKYLDNISRTNQRAALPTEHPKQTPPSIPSLLSMLYPTRLRARKQHGIIPSSLDGPANTKW